VAPSSDCVRVSLPVAHAAGFRQSMAGMSEFTVEDAGDGVVSVEPREGAGAIRRYFEAFRLCSGDTDLDDAETWRPILRRPPFSPKPQITIPGDMAHVLPDLDGRGELIAVIKRLAARVAVAEPSTLPGELKAELPALLRRYPGGSLWYIAVDNALVSRLAFARVRLQLELTPDLGYDPQSRDRVSDFGMHNVTGGIDFGKVFDSALLSFPPAASGFSMSTFPHALVFLFGEFEDLRTRAPGPLAEVFFPSVSATDRTPGVKVPVGNLATADLEALLQWWTTRLDLVYSHASDPTRFQRAGTHDAPAQAGWIFTLERMMADAAFLLAAVASPPLLRAQAAFDLLDKADSLLTAPHKKAEGKNFKRLLRQQEVMPRLERALQRMPIRLQQRFLTYARQRYAQFYADIAEHTMRDRRRPNGVMVALNDPADLRLMPWDEYVPELMRAARNSSHGLQDIMREPKDANARHQRLLLATNSGDIPSSFFEVVAIAYLCLMADAERLCDRTWWDLADRA
jgi:hypothetical protein